MKRTLISLALLLPASPVMASFYVGVGVASSVLSSGQDCEFSECKTDKLDDGQLMAGLTVGLQVAEYLDIEGRYHLGLIGDENRTERTERSWDSGLSLLLKPNYSVTEQITAYGLLGSSRMEFTNSNEFSTRTHSSNFPLLYGLGAEYDFNQIYIGLEYLSIGNDFYENSNTGEKWDWSMSTISLTAGYRF